MKNQNDNAPPMILGLQPAACVPEARAVRPNESPAPMLLLFTAHPALAGLRHALRARGLAAVHVASLEEGQQLLAAHRGNSVAVLDTFQPAPYSFDAVYRLLHEAPPVHTLLVAHEERGHSIARSRKEAAVDDHVYLPASIDELVLRVQALLLRAGLTVPSVTRTTEGQIVVVFGLKGGIGRSTIAANLSVGLAQRYGYQVALLDADLWYGAQRALLDLDAEKGLTSLRHLGEHLDEHALREVLVPHASGVQVLLGPADPTQVETIPVDLPARAASAYRGMFDFVVVDTHPSMEENVLQLLEIADRVVLVLSPELGPLRSTLQVLKLAPRLGWADKLLLVVNRADSGVDLEHLEEALGRRVDVSIVSAGRRVLEAANQGKPVLLMDPTGRERIARDLLRLVARIAGEPEPRGESEGAPAAWRRLWRLPWTAPRAVRDEVAS